MSSLLSLSRLIDRINERIGHALYWLILVAVLISAANAVVRKAFNYSSNAFLEIQWYLFSAIFLFGAGYTLLRNEHVRIDVIAGRLSRARAGLDRHLRHAVLPAADGDPDHVAVVAGVRRCVRAQRGVDQRRRPDHLAGAAAGAGRLLPADRCRASRS